MSNSSLYYRRIASYPAPLRLGYFIFLLLCLWVPFAVPLSLFFAHDPNFLSIVVMGLLFGQFLWFLGKWSQRVYGQRGLKFYGLVWGRKNALELLSGLIIGLSFTWLLFLVQAWCGWVSFQAASPNFWRIVLEGSLTGLGVAFAEELFFRGWLLTELERDYTPQVALVSTALIFALVHFLKPFSEVVRTFPQFPALMILGLLLVWAKRAFGNRLGICIGLHGGLIWAYYQLKVGKLITYTGKISPLVTGIDKNPLMGLMGILFLSVLAICIQRLASHRRARIDI